MAPERKNMILADKIINERKKCGWSQEELAEKLGVSRQSVSKWEGAQSVPDLGKILLMADLFGVTTDYLLKDEIVPTSDNNELRADSDSVPPKIKISMEEANEFLSLKRWAAPRMAIGAALCVISPVPIIFLAGLSEVSKYNISENFAGGLGTILLFVIITIAVLLMTNTEHRVRKYANLSDKDFETEYGVTGMVRERQASFDATNHRNIMIGITLSILGVVPILISAFLEFPDYVTVMMVCVMFLMIATAAILFTYTTIISGSMKLLLNEDDTSYENRKKEKRMGNISSVYWCIVVAIFLGYNFVTKNYDTSWIIWPVAGVLYAAFRGIVSMFFKED